MERLCGSHYCRRERARGRHVSRAEQGLQLCLFCCKRVRADITELTKLYWEFESGLVRFPFSFEERVSGGDVKGLCLNEASVNARFDIIAVLATWCGMVAEERRLTRPTGRDVPGLAAFLTRNLDWLLAHASGPDFADEIVTMTATARRASRPGSVHLPLGRCAEEDCESALYATGITEGAPSPVQVRCEAGHVWQSYEWLMLASRVRSHERQRPSRMSGADAGQATA
jgi:hypothetical protein